MKINFIIKNFNIANSLSDDIVNDESNEVLVIKSEDSKKIEVYIAFQSNMVSNKEGMVLMP